jgi:hypothetical protein
MKEEDKKAIFGLSFPAIMVIVVLAVVLTKIDK